MADVAFDAVIIGGGTKTLVTAIYLAKYGGLSVGVFERRRQIGGALDSDEFAAAGFIGDHAANLSESRFLPVKDDFPDFVEKGGKLAHYRGVLGMIAREDQSCGVVYSQYEDPAQELTAASLARFAGDRDAETYLKLWKVLGPGSTFRDALVRTTYNLAPPPGQPTPLESWMVEYLAQPDCLIDERWLELPVYQAALELWDNPAAAFMWLRRTMTGGATPIEHKGSISMLTAIATTPTLAFAVGGTHNIAHAYYRILLENGGKVFCENEADKIVIENGRAQGIRLANGASVEAKQLVISGVDPYQLCFRLIGREYLSDRILRKIRNLQRDATVATWYNWALHRPPEFQAAHFNPDINACENTILGSRDPEILLRQAFLRRLGQIPPVDTLYCYQYSHADATRAPEGKYVLLTEHWALPATALSEREWIELKRRHAQELLDELRRYAPNMSWDNVAGYSPTTPYDLATKVANMGPAGNIMIIDPTPGQTGKFRPIMELAQHRTPIANLYATGGAWRGGAMCAEGYNCYKAIAEDLGLGKPWEEKGRSY